MKRAVYPSPPSLELLGMKVESTSYCTSQRLSHSVTSAATAERPKAFTKETVHEKIGGGTASILLGAPSPAIVLRIVEHANDAPLESLHSFDVCMFGVLGIRTKFPSALFCSAMVFSGAQNYLR